MTRLVAVLVIVASAMVAVSHPMSEPRVTLARASGASLQVQIILDRTTARAGHAIGGEAIITNNTKKPIGGGCGPPLVVGLVSSRVLFEPIWDAATCPGTMLSPGRNWFPITVQTTYQWCYERAADPPYYPKCRAGRDPMPLLPPGTYHTKTNFNALPASTPQSAPIQVTVV